MTPHPAELAHLRQQMDAVDTALLVLLRQRLDIAERIGTVKQRHGLPPLQPERWQQVQTARLALADAQGLPAPMVQRLLAILHRYSLAVQEPADATALGG